MRLAIAVLLLLSMPAGSVAQEVVEDDAAFLSTPAELEGWFAPTTPEETADFLVSLQTAFPDVRVETLASLPGGPAAPDSSLPVYLVGIRSGGTHRPERVRVLILAGQRGDEFTGPEVSLRMMRDLASGALPGLLDKLEVGFVPAVNPWGLLWWMREDPTGVDPVRDHASLRSKSLHAVHSLVAEWKPDLVIELRDLGPAAYRIQAGLPVHPNADPELAHYGRFYLLPYVANELAKASITFREEIAVNPEPLDRAPLIRGAESLPEGGYLTPGPLGADRARNAFALGGSLSLMLGVASMEGPDGLGSREELQYLALKALLEVTAGRADGLRARTDSARRVPAPEGGSDGSSAGKAFTLRSRYETDPRMPELTWLVWSEYGTLMSQTTDRWRSAVRRLLALSLPAAWVIESEATGWADLARAHGFVVERLTRDSRIEVEAYPVGVVDRLPADLAEDLTLGEALDASPLLVRAEREFSEGTWVVRSDQPRARLLFTLLEPWSQDAPLTSDHTAAEEVAAEAADAPEDPSFLHPVYRIDASALSRLRTEVPDDSASTRNTSD